MVEMIKMTKCEWIFLDIEINEKSVDITGYHFYHFAIIIYRSKNNIFQSMV